MVSINLLRLALRSVWSCATLLCYPLLIIKLIIIFAYFVPRAPSIALPAHACLYAIDLLSRAAGKYCMGRGIITGVLTRFEESYSRP